MNMKQRVLTLALNHPDAQFFIVKVKKANPNFWKMINLMPSYTLFKIMNTHLIRREKLPYIKDKIYKDHAVVFCKQGENITLVAE